jgi:hypothetical protein
MAMKQMRDMPSWQGPWRETGKVAIGQLIRQGHEHLVGIKALKGGLMLCILRYPYELRDPKSYFEEPGENKCSKSPSSPPAAINRHFCVCTDEHHDIRPPLCCAKS